MYLIRGIRSLSSRYARDFVGVPETEENIKSYVALETEDDECAYVKFADDWPDSIVLDAQMVPSRISSLVFVERYENGISLGKNSIYDSPIIHHSSVVTNPRSFCSKISLKFERSGEYLLHDEKKSFFNNSFDEYKLDIDNDILFEKKFLVLDAPIVEKFTKKIGEQPTLEGTNERAPYKAYPYAGFYEFGAHPQEIESCVFQVSSDELKSSIKLWKLSSFSAKYGMDPTTDGVVNDGNAFVGVKNFSPSQKLNLYDEIKNGCCKISVKNISTNEICEYKSEGVYHRLNTNLIKINFTKEEEK